MIRLAIVGYPTEQAARLGARLGGAVVAGQAEADAFVVRCVSAADAGLCERLAAAGKHMLMTGPAATAEAAEAVTAACGRAGVRFMFGHVARFRPSVAVVKDALGRGQLGEPGLLRVHRWRPGEPLDLFRDIDLALWLFGRLPAVVYAAGKAEGYTQLHLGFPDGGMALLDAATLPAGGEYYSLSLIGSAGAAYADDHHDMQLLFAGGPAQALPTGQGEAELLGLWQAFVSAVADGREPSVTAADARAAQRVAEAAARSLATGRAIHTGGEP